MKNKYVLITLMNCLVLICAALFACSGEVNVEISLKDCDYSYSVGKPIDIEDHYTSNKRNGITAKVCYNDDGISVEKSFSGNIYWPVVGGEHTFTVYAGEKSISFSVNVDYMTPSVTADSSPFVYKVGSVVYFDDLVAVKNPNVYPSDATLNFKNVKFRTVDINLEETTSEWEDADYDSHEKCFDVTEKGEYLVTYEACFGDKSTEASFTVVSVANKNDGNDNVLTYNDKYASKNVIVSGEDDNIFRLPQNSDYTEASFLVLNHKFALGEEVSVTFKGKNVPQIGMLVTPNDQSSNPFGLFSTKGHVLSFEYKGNDRYVLMGPNGFNSNAVKTAVESRGEYWGWDNLDSSKYYRLTAKLNKRNATTNFVSYTVFEITDYGNENQSEKYLRSLDQSGWTASSDGEINDGYFVLYGSKNKSITFKAEYGDKAADEGIITNSVSYNKDGSAVIDQTCKNNTDNTIQGGYLAFTQSYQTNTTVSFDFTGKNIPNICFFADKISGETNGDKGLYLSADGNDIAVYGPKRLQSSSLVSEQNSAFGRNNLTDGEHYRYTITSVSGGTYKVKFNLRLDKIDGNCLLGVAETSLTAEYRSNNPKGSIIIYGTTSKRLTFTAYEPEDYAELKKDASQLAFESSSAEMLRDSEKEITLLGSAADSNNITWRIGNGNIACFSDGKLQAKEVGSTTVYAMTGEYVAELSLTVVEKLYLQQSEMRIVIGDEDVQLILYGTANKGNITFTADNDCLTVSDTGVLTAVSQGVTRVTASVTSGFGTETAECTVTVALPVIHFEQPEYVIRLYDEKSLMLQYIEDKTITWSSSDNNIAEVSENGLVTAKGVGSVTITARADNGETDTCTVNVTDIMHKASYVKSTGDVELKQDSSGTSYTDTSYVELGDYENGAYVVMEFSGKNMPQIAFFAEGATDKPVENSIDCLLFTSDVVTTDYRMFPYTNPNYGAVMANKWNKAAIGNLDSKSDYVFIIGCTRDALKYYITLRLYVKNADGSISLVEGGSLDTDYAVSDQYINVSGNEIVLYGSRNSDIKVKIKIYESLEQAESAYTKAQ